MIALSRQSMLWQAQHRSPAAYASEDAGCGLWNKPTSLFALLWARRLRRRSLTNANSELIRSQIDAEAGCAKTILATVCNSGVVEPCVSHHMYAGVVLAHDGKHDRGR